jgi:hypothetical protein
VSDEEDISELRGHIDAAHQAADRLVREAQARAEAADAAHREQLSDVPPRGWDVPHESKPGGRDQSSSELQLVVNLLGALRDAIPAELSQQLAEAVRELLLAVRALIDWYLNRLERLPRPGQTSAPDDPVEDIPIA